MNVKRKSTPQLVNHIQTHMNSNNQVKTTFRNKLINRNMKHHSITDRSNGIQLRNSFYNDENLDYLSRSNIMLKTSRSYQAKAISQSIRKRLNTEKIEQVIRKKKNESFYSVKSEGRLPTKLCQSSVSRSRSQMNMTRLSTKPNPNPRINKQILERYINTKLQMNKQSEVKWFSIFKNRTKAENPFDGKTIHSVKKRDYSTDQLKVLNIDRLFKGNHKTGLKNIPLPKPQPMMSTSKILNRNSLHVEQSKGMTLNYLIREFNNLCKIDSFLKVRKGLSYVKGKAFMQQPTLEEILGVRSKILRRTTPTTNLSSSQFLRPSVFEQYCVFYRNNIRKDPYLKERLITGLTLGEEGLTFQSYLHFHELFVSRAASHNLKLQFLQHFFIPAKTETISIEMFRLLMELLSERLPEASSIQIRWREGFDLPSEQKAKIFYETLMKVLIGEVEDRLRQVGLINRDVIKWIFGRNEDSLNLLLLLFYVKGKLSTTFSEPKPITSRI